MYISESIKDQLRQYEGQAIEIDAKQVSQPVNPGDGLIRSMTVIGRAHSDRASYKIDGVMLAAQLVAINGSLGVELTITNETQHTTLIDSSQIGLLLLSSRTAEHFTPYTPSDGPSTAVITRANVLLREAEFGMAVGNKLNTYTYRVTTDDRFPENFELEPNGSRRARIVFKLPAGQYQFFAGYGGGAHESKSIVSNPVSLDLSQDQSFPN